MSETTTLPTARSRRRTRIALIAVTALAVVLTPFAVNGLFAGALSNVDQSIDAIPAAIVNEDQMVTTTNPDGTQSVNFAGRGLVTELTGGGQTGFDWTVTNADDAAKGLQDGTYYAVLTIPSDFSATVGTLATASPQQALLDIRTDDSHSYLTGVLAGTVGSAVQAGFGQTITATVVNGIYTSFGTLGTSMQQAADGADQLGTGAGQLATGSAQLADGLTQYSDGVSQLSSGIGQYTAGASQLASGVDQYVGGVSQLSTGLQDAAAGADGLDSLATRLPAIPKGLQTAADSASQLAALAAADPTNPALAPGLAQLAAGLTQSAQSAAPLAESAPRLSALASGLRSASSGASQLAANGSALTTGADQLAANGPALASGADQLAANGPALVSGAQQLGAGAAQLQNGATQLSDGLSGGAQKLESSTGSDPQAAADVIAQPVKVDVTTQNQASTVGQVVSTLILPIALWIGALALFLWLRPFSRAVLASSVSTPRLVLGTFLRAAVFAGAQAVAVVAFLHVALGAPWHLLPATLGFSVLISLAFVAFHQLLTTAFGRVGAILSLVLLGLQIVATGGLYPIEVLAPPFQVISAVSPLAYAVSGIQTILTGGEAGTAWAAGGVLALLLVASLLLTLAALARRRGPVATGWVVPAWSVRSRRTRAA